MFRFFKKYFIHLFIFRGRRREGEKEGEKHQCVGASHAPLSGDLACNPNMCPVWELISRPPSPQAGSQSTEPYQPGLNWSVLIPWVCFVNLYGRRSMIFSSAVSLISWTCFFWDALSAIYVGSLYVIEFWLLLGHSLVRTSLRLVDCGSLRPRHLVCCCAGAAWTKPQSPGNKPIPGKITPPPQSHYQQQVN